MAIQFPDLTPGGPTATSNDKVVHQKTVRLLNTDFVTGGTASVKAVFPADSTFIGLTYWKKTQFSGGGVTAVTLSLGIPGTPTNFASAIDVLTPVTGSEGHLSPVTNIMQPYNVPQGPDISLLFTGTATTGNPTAGEMYVTIYYVR